MHVIGCCARHRPLSPCGLSGRVRVRVGLYLQHARAQPAAQVPRLTRAHLHRLARLREPHLRKPRSGARGVRRPLRGPARLRDQTRVTPSAARAQRDRPHRPDHGPVRRRARRPPDRPERAEPGALAHGRARRAGAARRGRRRYGLGDRREGHARLPGARVLRQRGAPLVAALRARMIQVAARTLVRPMHRFTAGRPALLTTWGWPQEPARVACKHAGLDLARWACPMNAGRARSPKQP